MAASDGKLDAARAAAAAAKDGCEAHAPACELS
jgi:hypothetical protein